MRNMVSRLGFLISRSTKLIIARDNPARSAKTVMESPRFSRSSRRMRAT